MHIPEQLIDQIFEEFLRLNIIHSVVTESDNSDRHCVIGCDETAEGVLVIGINCARCFEWVARSGWGRRASLIVRARARVRTAIDFGNTKRSSGQTSSRRIASASEKEGSRSSRSVTRSWNEIKAGHCSLCIVTTESEDSVRRRRVFVKRS